MHTNTLTVDISVFEPIHYLSDVAKEQFRFSVLLSQDFWAKPFITIDTA